MPLTPAPFSHEHSLYRSATENPEKNPPQYITPSHIYPLKSLPIPFSPRAANYRETPTTSWAVICGAADAHPLDLLSLSPPETSRPLSLPAIPPVNSPPPSPTCECQPPFSFLFFSFLRSLFPQPFSSPLSCNDLHAAFTTKKKKGGGGEGGGGKNKSPSKITK